MLEILAPAKLNLGLEITGRRADGYHNLRTVFCSVSLFDRLTFIPSDMDSFHVDRHELAENNLVARALSVWDDAGLHRPGVGITLSKRIPPASGLGGASSDAASTLRALNRISTAPVSEDTLCEMALAIGSDVPFFLTGGVALAEGRGEKLRPIAACSFAAIIVVPPIKIANKTATMFRSLNPDDFTDGSRLEAIANTSGLIGRDTVSGFINTFERPLYHRYPEMVTFAQAVEEVTNRKATVSGAGPAMFVTVEDMREAQLLRARLRTAPELASCAIHVVRAVHAHGSIEHLHD